MTSESPYKLLFIAYACGPGRGSEWGLGWHYVEDLARTQPVWLVTHEDNRSLIEPYLRDRHKTHPVNVTYVRLPGVVSWMRNSFYSLYNLHYYLWQFAAARAAKRIHRAVKLDLIQHVSLFRWWMPSAGASLVDDGVGFIFGHVGGGDQLPKRFSRNGPISARFSDFFRLLARNIWRHDPLLKRCIRRADLLLAGVPSCETWFRRYGGKNIAQVCSAIAGSAELQAAASEARAGRLASQPFTFASCGGLSYYRGVDLAVRAFAKANLPNARYIHLCDGPMRGQITQLARDLGVADRVELPGDMPHVDCVRAVARADACVHTVLRDSQGAIVEAMLAGVPVMTLDHLTPAMIVTNECGTKIPIDDNTTPEQIVDRIALAMRDWYEHPEKVAAMGEAAKRRAEIFSTAAKGEQYRAFHRSVIRQLAGRAASNAVATPRLPHSSAAPGAS
ncbi:MAG: glycosyltransferase [Burkholderiales bacterium]|nr:glycosyltransferase [Phycisphaerae bacterium]